MADNFNFKVDASDYRGVEHEEFRTNLLNLALTEPTKYNTLRMNVLKKVKKAAVDNQYAIYYYLLTDGHGVGPDGKTKSANNLFFGTTSATEIELFKPNVPKHIVNEFALKASATIDKIAEEALNMIMPKDWKTIADERLYSKTKGNLGFAEP
jgi:hypothetical protein